MSGKGAASSHSRPGQDPQRHTLGQSSPTLVVPERCPPQQPWDGCGSCALTPQGVAGGGPSGDQLCGLEYMPGLSGPLCPYLQSKAVHSQRAGASGLSRVSWAKVLRSHCRVSSTRHLRVRRPRWAPPGLMEGSFWWKGEAAEVSRNPEKVAKCRKNSEQRHRRWRRSEGPVVAGQGGPPRAASSPGRRGSRAVLGRGSITADGRP